jgi:serine protease Do
VLLLRNIVTVLVLALPGLATADGPLWSSAPLVEPLPDGAPLRSDTFTRIAEAFRPAVVSVETEGDLHTHGPHGEPHRKKGKASGFIVHPSGLVLTNQHVIDKKAAIAIELWSGERYEAKVIGQDPETDLALLRLQAAPADLPVAPLGDSGRLRVGEWVVAIGNPLGLEYSVTAGIVSALGRRDVKTRPEQVYANWIQTDAFIYKGSSGGPLIDTRGQVVGITTAIKRENLTLAIPIDMVKTLLPQLAAGRVERSSVGLRFGPVPAAVRAALRLERGAGAAVTEVAEGGPAAEADVAVGDVLTAFDDRPVTEADDVAWLVTTAPPGRTVKLALLRDGEALERTVVTAPRGPGASSRAGPPKRAGAPTLAQRAGLHVAERSGSVWIEEVRPDSAAERGGAETGDKIESIDGRQVRKAADLDSDGVIIELVVERDDARFYVPLDLSR